MNRKILKARTIVSLCLSVCMIMAVFGTMTPARADSSDMSYEVDGGKLYFDSAQGMITWAQETVTSAEIPEKINGITVKTIGEWAFYNNDKLTSVKLPATLKKIQKGAFWGCSSIDSIVIPKSVTTIEKDAFKYCYSLFDVTFEGKKSDISMKNAFDNWMSIGGDFSKSYKKGKYYKKLMKVKLTGNVRNNIIKIAKSQYGYHEGKSESDLSGNSKSQKNYTEFARLHGNNPILWCGEFAEWCIEMGGIPTSMIYENKYKWKKTKYAGKGGKNVLKKGDILRVKHDSGGHMVLVVSVKKKGKYVYIKFRDGGHGDRVYADTVKMVAKTGKGVGYYNTWRVDFLASPNYNKLKFHKLTFNPNGGTVAYKSRKAVEGSMYSIMPTPKKSGAKFAGWFTEPEGGVQVKPYMPFGKKEDQTLYAHWK